MTGKLEVGKTGDHGLLKKQLCFPPSRHRFDAQLELLSDLFVREVRISHI